MRMSKVNAIKNFFYSERVIIGFLVALGLAVTLELTGVYLLMILAGGIAGFFVKKGWLSFFIGFISVALAWGIYFIVFAFMGPLSEFFSLIGSIIGISGTILMIMSIIVGGLLGGVGALIGAYVTQLILGEKYTKNSKVNN